MKLSIIQIAIFAVLIAAACAHFDFTHHQNGHELTVSMRDETEKIWVVFVEKNPADKQFDQLKNQNKELKNQVKQRLYNEDVYFTELDLTDPQSQANYDEFSKLVKLDLTLLEQGPVVALVYDKKGYWIHGHGIPQETVDTIHSFILQKEANENRNKPVSVGGPVRHPSSFEAFGGGQY